MQGRSVHGSRTCANQSLTESGTLEAFEELGTLEAFEELGTLEGVGGRR